MWDFDFIKRLAEDQLQDKRLIVGVTGGVAAYKSLELVRLLVKRGACVQVVMSRGANSFIQPLSFQALSGHPVRQDIWDESSEAAMGHIELAKWAQAILIAPASAHTLAKLAHGFADDLLTTLCLATQAQRIFAPAMNQQMWQDAATQANVALLQQRGYQCFGPDIGAQACGDQGPGRLLEPHILVSHLASAVSVKPALGLRCLITAGATQEPIDQVRFISNQSSGKMGYGLARAANALGFETHLISGPTNLTCPDSVQRQEVQTADQMLEEAAKIAVTGVDLIIGCAAVADIKPVVCAAHKVSKQQLGGGLELVQTPDVIATLSEQFPNAFKVGFAAQSGEDLTLGKAKLVNKKLDVIAVNDISQPDLGMNADHNQVILIHKSDQDLSATLRLGPALKDALARQILAAIWWFMQSKK